MLDTPRSEVVLEYWLPTPFASFPFTSPPVRHRVPSGFKRTLQCKVSQKLINMLFLMFVLTTFLVPALHFAASIDFMQWCRKTLPHYVHLTITRTLNTNTHTHADTISF